MNPKYRFYLDSGKLTEVNSQFYKFNADPGVEWINNGLLFPVGTNPFNSSFGITKIPFSFDNASFPGQRLQINLSVTITNYAELNSLPTLWLFKYVNGNVTVGEQFDYTYRDIYNGDNVTRIFQGEITVTEEDIINKRYYLIQVPTISVRPVEKEVRITADSFTLRQTGGAICYPQYGNNLGITYAMENGERFYRRKLTGNIRFIAEDFRNIISQDIETEFRLNIYMSTDNFQTSTLEFEGRFFLTDCTINLDDEHLEVNPSPLDEYTDVLAGLEKEYNLIDLAPEINPVAITKRPALQIYSLGESIISCYLSGNYWEQDCTVVHDTLTLFNKYHFNPHEIVMVIDVETNESTSQPEVGGIYVGNVYEEYQPTRLRGLLYNQDNPAYFLRYERYTNSGNYNHEFVLSRLSDNQSLYLAWRNNIPDEFMTEITLIPSSTSPETGTVDLKINTSRLYIRLLLDNNTFAGQPAFGIPEDDITANNRNYHYVIPYEPGVMTPVYQKSIEPTKWGRDGNGLYFLPPPTSDRVYIPVSRSYWDNVSLWFSDLAFNYNEPSARKSYILRDTFPISSCIQVLLNQFAPGIKHEATPEYSEFLYSESNPISGDVWKLLVTQKSNLLIGEYQQPASKAMTTLSAFLEMLRNVFQCYWMIRDGKFIIEHVSWFRDGGTYTADRGIGVDLTTLIQPRVGQAWAFGTNNYSYDKTQMPERYEFSWMDDSSEYFLGSPIEILSKQVQEGSIEKISIGSFSTDVDLMLLNPSEMSRDGFALFAAVKRNILNMGGREYVLSTYPGGGNEDYTPTYNIDPGNGGKTALLTLYADDPGEIRPLWPVFFDSNGTRTELNQGHAPRGRIITVEIIIPEGAVSYTLNGASNTNVRTYSIVIKDSLTYQVPITTRNDALNKRYINQNGYLSFTDLLPKYWRHDLPARNIRIGDDEMQALGISRKKKQQINFPDPGDIDTNKLIRTGLGDGEIQTMTVNLTNRNVNATLNYDTE